MNKLLKTSLIALAGIVFFGVNYATTPSVSAAAPTIKVFTVTPNPATAGTNIAITWQSDADNCYLGGDPWASFPGGESPAQSASGSWNQAQAINTGTTPRQMTVKIRCENIALAGPDVVASNNESSYQEKTITVNPAGTAPVITLSTDPSQISPDTKTMTITWSSTATNANGCTASGPGWSGIKPSSGTEPITPTLGTYQLTCKGPGGSTTKEIVVGSVASSGDLGAAAPGTSTTDLSKLVCFSFTTGISVGGCAAQAIYYIIYIPTSWLLYGAGFIFDTAITLSIDKSFIVKPFIAELWTVIRNFSNMIFIFILLYTGVSTMLGMGNWRKTVINVLIIALLINFSLFFTKVVIDAGNVLAVGVYSSMGAEKDRQTTEGGTLKERNISAALVRGFNPQSFIGAEPFDKPLDAIVVFFIAATVSVFTAYIFFKAAMLFVGRLLAFWYLMIISPFAFTSIVLPKGNMFSSWTDDLLNQAFVAPVFLFFIYIIMKIISTNVLAGMLNASNAGVGDFFFNKLIVPIIFAAMIIFALQKALKVAEKMGGDFGAMASKFVGSAVGSVATVAVGAATGGAAMALRGTVGAAASSLAEGEALRGMATSSRTGMIGSAQRFLGRQALSSAESVSNATFDVRNVGAVAKGAKAVGVEMKGGKLGYVKEREAWDKEDKARADKLEVTKKAQAEMVAAPTREASAANKLVEEHEGRLKENKQAASATPQGIALETAIEEEKTAKQKLDDAKKKEDEALAELDKAKKIGDTARETAARGSLAIASAQVQSESIAHGTAQSNKVVATRSYDATPEAAALKAQETALEAAVKDQKAKAQALAEATESVKKVVAQENDYRRERFARDTSFTRNPLSTIAGGPKSEQRVEAIRKAGSTAAKEAQKAEKDMAKMLAAFAKEAAKNNPPAPKP